MELNKLIQFSDISEANFESVLRRIALIKIQAQFFEERYLKQQRKDHEKFGVFKRDSDMKKFLTSTVGVAAGHKAAIQM